MKRIFLTGATGVMGMAGVRSILRSKHYPGEIHLTVLARDSKVNRRKFAPFQERGVEVIWGDLTHPADVARGVKDADMVLHVGGMVSPVADWEPERTMKVNIGAISNIIAAAKDKEARGESVEVVYIGSVSQYGPRRVPLHWGRAGDPIRTAVFDNYALSKSLGERMLANSGLKRWVSLRQTGIMHPGILLKASDPISFHVPMRGALEWITADESGDLLARLCDSELPESFWRGFYNIGGGASSRFMNYDFMGLTLSAVGCPPPEKVFDLNWFATGNFHGIWFGDSDVLENLLHFRSGQNFREYVGHLKAGLPFYFRLAPLAPAFIIKEVMKRVAKKKVLGPLRWLAEGNAPRIEAAWGGIEEFRRIPGWERFDRTPLPQGERKLNHGYDESKPLAELDGEDMRAAAEFRGGRCLSERMEKGDVDSLMEWECAEGHRFRLTPRAMLKGGHWCEDCLREISKDPHAATRQAAKNRFLAQIV